MGISHGRNDHMHKMIHFHLHSTPLKVNAVFCWFVLFQFNCLYMFSLVSLPRVVVVSPPGKAWPRAHLCPFNCSLYAKTSPRKNLYPETVATQKLQQRKTKQLQHSIAYPFNYLFGMPKPLHTKTCTRKRSQRKQNQQNKTKQLQHSIVYAMSCFTGSRPL